LVTGLRVGAVVRGQFPNKVQRKASAREVRHKARRREAILDEGECILGIERDEHEKVITANADILLLSVLMVKCLVMN